MRVRLLDLPDYARALAGLPEGALDLGPCALPEALPVIRRHRPAGRFLGVLAESGGAVVGALPLVETAGGRLLRPLTAGLACQLDLAVAPGWEARVVRALVATLRADTRAWALDLPDLRRGTALHDALLRRRTWNVAAHVCPWMPLAPDLDRALGRKRRHELRRKARRLAEHGEVRHLVVDAERPERLPEMLDRAFALHARRHAGRMSAAALARPGDRARLRALMALWVPRGRALLSLLFVGDRLATFFLGAVRGATFVAVLTAFDEAFAAAGPSHVHIHRLARHLADRGFAALDFSKGAFAYKRRWAREAYHLDHAVVALRGGTVAELAAGPALTLRDIGRTTGLNARLRPVVERLRPR